jgi:hypothetical protein
MNTPSFSSSRKLKKFFPRPSINFFTKFPHIAFSGYASLDCTVVSHWLCKQIAGVIEYLPETGVRGCYDENGKSREKLPLKITVRDDVLTPRHTSVKSLLRIETTFCIA